MNVTYNVGGVMCDISLKAEFPIFLSNKIKKGGKVRKKIIICENSQNFGFQEKTKKSHFFTNSLKTEMALKKNLS